MKDLLRGILPVLFAILFIGAALFAILGDSMGASYAWIFCAPVALAKLLPSSLQWLALPLIVIDLPLYAAAGIWLGLKLGHRLGRQPNAKEPP